MNTITIPADPRPIEFDPKESALIIVDMQGAFLQQKDDGAAFANTGLGIDASKGGVENVLPIIPEIQSLVTLYREKGWHIVHLGEEYNDYDHVPWIWQQGVIGDPVSHSLNYLQAGSAEVALNVIPPITGETVFKKNGKNAFKVLHIREGIAEPLLRHILRDQLKVRHLIFTGIATSVCVGTTAMSAAEEGFNPILVGDACGDFYPERHDRTLKMFGLGKEQETILFGSVIHTAKDLCKVALAV